MKKRFICTAVLLYAALMLSACVESNMNIRGGIAAPDFTHEPVQTAAPAYFEEFIGFLSDYWPDAESLNRKEAENDPWYQLGRSVAALDSTAVVAEVNGEAIFEMELDAELLKAQCAAEQNIRYAEESPDFSDEMVVDVKARTTVPARDEILDEIIEKRLVQQEAALLGIVPGLDEMVKIVNESKASFALAKENGNSYAYQCAIAYWAGLGISREEQERAYLDVYYRGIVSQKFRIHVIEQAGLNPDSVFEESEEAYRAYIESCRSNAAISLY